MRADVAYCGKLFDYRGFLGEACVNVDGSSGLIVSITRLAEAERVVLDVRGSEYILSPSLIDMHVHLRGLQLSYKENEETGSLEALRGGIGLVVDMPNTLPRLETVTALREKLSRLKSMSWVDYGVYAAIPRSQPEVKALASEPIAGFKVYPQDIYGRFDVVYAAARTGKLLVVHAEHEAAEKPVVESEHVREAFRGCWAELTAILDVSVLEEGRLHITHVSCPEGVAAAKSAGATVDTTIHHLLGVRPLDGCGGRVNPPVRSETWRVRLLSLLAEGRIDALASDHAPHRARDKLDPLNCSPGLASLGYWTHVAFCLVRSRMLSLAELLKLTTYNPARILGVDKLYGRLEPGTRANILVYKVTAPEHTPAKLYSRGDNIPDYTLQSCLEIKAVVIGGRLAYLDGQPLERPPTVNAFSLAQASSSPREAS